MRREMLLKAGQKIFLSEKGHRGFLYPSNTNASVTKPTIASILPWNKIGALKPVLIDSNSISKTFSVERVAVWVAPE